MGVDTFTAWAYSAGKVGLAVRGSASGPVYLGLLLDQSYFGETRHLSDATDMGGHITVRV